MKLTFEIIYWLGYAAIFTVALVAAHDCLQPAGKHYGGWRWLWRGLCWLARWVALLMLWAIVIAMIGALLHIGWETGRYALELWGHL